MSIAISCNVVAVPPRMEQVHIMENELRRQGFPEINVHCDNNWDGQWVNVKRALRGASREMEYNLVLQDDALIPRTFAINLQAAMRQLPALKPSLASLFYTKGKGYFEAAQKGISWYASNNLWGLAILYPLSLIDEVIEWGDTYGDPEWQGYDLRIAGWQIFTNRLAYTTIPCLVEHSDGKSVVGHASKSKAGVFIGDRIKQWDKSFVKRGNYSPESFLKTWDPNNNKFGGRLS